MYKVLGVKRTDDKKTIKKAYRKLAVRNHPDKGGDPEEFKKIAGAWDVLGDDKKRKLYDQYGKKGLEAGGNPQGDMDDMMSMFFGGGRRSRSSEPSGPKKGKPVVHALRVSLKDLYKGKTMRMRITRNTICRRGQDEPVELEDVESTFTICPACRGRGAVMKTRQIGPGFIQQMQCQCDDCNGSGAALNDGFVQKKKRELLEVKILKGMRNNQKITMRGKGDMIPGQLPGDVIFVIKQVNDDNFKRRGRDLLIEKEVSLLEALCGVSWRMKHLDGKEYFIKTSPGEVLKTQDVKIVEDLGMPVQDTIDFGRLFVVFKVQFPQNGELKDDQIQALEAVLGPRNTPRAELGKEEEEHFLESVDASTFGKMEEEHRGALDESDDEDGMGGRGGQGVQCAQQ